MNKFKKPLLAIAALLSLAGCVASEEPSLQERGQAYIETTRSYTNDHWEYIVSLNGDYAYCKEAMDQEAMLQEVNHERILFDVNDYGDGERFYQVTYFGLYFEEPKRGGNGTYYDIHTVFSYTISSTDCHAYTMEAKMLSREWN